MNYNFRQATKSDLTAMVMLLADDELGQTREDTSSPLAQQYLDAFHRIEKDPNNELIIIEHHGKLAGMLQLTFIPYLTHVGSTRCLIEGVRISKEQRGQGLGTRMMEWAIQRAKDKQCSIVQLTSDKQRPEALNFYRSLGFRATHEGFKLTI